MEAVAEAGRAVASAPESQTVGELKAEAVRAAAAAAMAAVERLAEADRARILGEMEEEAVELAAQADEEEVGYVAGHMEIAQAHLRPTRAARVRCYPLGCPDQSRRRRCTKSCCCTHQSSS